MKNVRYYLIYKFFNTIQSVIEDHIKPLTSQDVGGLSIGMNGYNIVIHLNPDSSGQADGHPLQELIYKHIIINQILQLIKFLFKLTRIS